MKNYKVDKSSVLILGVTGQDGSLLALNYLKKKKKFLDFLRLKERI